MSVDVDRNGGRGPGTDHLIVSVASSGLAGAAPELPGEPLDDPAWSALALAAFHQRLSGLLLDVVEDGVMAATETQRDHAAALAATWYERTGAIDASLVRAHAALQAAGIDHRVVKGPATAVRLYGSSLRRPYSDGDLVVPEGSFREAISVLERAGWRRPEPPRRPGFDERFAHAVTLRDGKAELDLHRMLVHPPAGDLLPRDLGFDLPPDHVEIGGVQMPVLPPGDAFMHAVAHGAFDHASAAGLLAARDIIAWSASLDGGAAYEHAERWRLGALPARAVAGASTRLSLSLAPSEPELGDWERKLLALTGGDVRARRLRTLRGRDRGRYVVGMLLPSRGYLRAVGQTRVGRARMVLRRLRSARSRR